MLSKVVSNTNIAAQVIFEDNHLIAVNKLPGQITQGDKTGDTPLGDLLKAFLKEKYRKPGNVFCGTIHRLDRPVSGIVLFAKTGKALERMNEQFRERKVQKTYWAVVKNKPPHAEETLVHYLNKNENKNKSFASLQPRKDATRCELSYKLLASSEHYHLLEVNPMTGRHHQIRVQLSAIGCVIKGDLKYGADRSNSNGSIHLHARKLNFIHPVKQESVNLTAPPPDDPLWNYFMQNLESL
ncbi:MAG: RNA pseudouridine synthase [Bacteroidetes bacterium]|nr:RNA pseudouridine synthase [Bacteroidia bacterium]MBX3106843.1 RNA pseudouridine synthase [Bacteroidota bacterium]MBV6454379.1 Ribosomal large subunit pseudouridine synthase C [Bacteroidia bacterium]MCB8931564.1 RNA pseudouridine synthase [Bacteroidia bacterium]MCO5289702.1 RNA pseudouridine synthase [Bacteroidota bacterium]